MTQCNRLREPKVDTNWQVSLRLFGKEAPETVCLTEDFQIDESDFDAVLVDVDNTLYNYTRSHDMALAAVVDRFQREFPDRVANETFPLLYRAHRSAVTSRLAGHGASRSRLLAFQALFEELGQENAIGHAIDYEDFYWSRHIDVMEPNKALIRWIHGQKAKSKPVCVVTNMQVAIQFRKIQRLGLAETVSYFVSSEEVGCEKPDKRIFRAALEKLKVASDRAIMIGDSSEHDIDGASALGIKTWQVKCYL